MFETLRSFFTFGRFSSSDYWERRYRRGGTSGSGSEGALASYKAEFINRFAREHGIGSTIEFGCGDGRQAALFELGDYTGADVSEKALELCRAKLGDRPGWRFLPADGPLGDPRDLALSLDVIYHLTEDAVFEAYMARLFDHASGHVLIYASDHDARTVSRHVRHRSHSRWVAENRPGWRVEAQHENPLAGRGKERSFAFFTHYAHAQE